MTNQASETPDELDMFIATHTSVSADTAVGVYREAEYHALKRALDNLVKKQIREVLDRLDKSMPTAEQLATKYGYHMPEKKYGYRLGLHDIRETIETERKKLDE